MNGRVVIRKYENRRLYDTSASRYVNLEDIARMVREGADLQVVDAKTGEDLTRAILTQIIVEDARDRESGLPLDFLREMVIASGRAGQETLATSLKVVSQMLQNAGGAAVNPLDFISRFIPGSGVASGVRDRSAENPEIGELRRRLDEMEQELRKRKQPGRARKKRA